MIGPYADSVGVKHAIHDQVVKIAQKSGLDARSLGDDEVIPDTGVLDSVGILELIVWLEMTFDRTIEQSELTVANFGTVNAIAAYLQRA
jgi:D-alanine--poly(phosphoribitol) ligase subunit 2